MFRELCSKTDLGPWSSYLPDPSGKNGREILQTLISTQPPSGHVPLGESATLSRSVWPPMGEMYNAKDMRTHKGLEIRPHSPTA